MANNSSWAKMSLAHRQLLKRELTKMKLSEQAKKKQEDELVECTFHPKICS